MPANSGPVILALILVTIPSLFVTLVARSTARKLVARERQDHIVATYRRSLPPDRVEAQEKARQDRQDQARVAASIGRWVGTFLTAVWVFALAYGTALAAGLTATGRLLAIAVAALTALLAARFRFLAMDTTFPELPERDPYDPAADKPLPSDPAPEQATAAARVGSAHRQASPERRKRRKQTARSRRANRT